VCHDVPQPHRLNGAQVADNDDSVEGFGQSAGGQGGEPVILCFSWLFFKQTK
jgi:hypothetical protein